MRRFVLTVVALAVAGALLAGCQTNTRMTVKNPTSDALFVQVNQREPVRVEAGASVRITLPALERFQPISVVARDRGGSITYSTSFTAAALDASGNVIDLSAHAHAYDPLLGY